MRAIPIDRLKIRFLFSFEASAQEMADQFETQGINAEGIYFKTPISAHHFSAVRSISIIFELGNKKSRYLINAPDLIINESNLVVGVELPMGQVERDKFSRDLTLARC